MMLNNSRELGCQVNVGMTNTLGQLALLSGSEMIFSIQSHPCSTPRPGRPFHRALTGSTTSSSTDPMCSPFCLSALPKQASFLTTPELQGGWFPLSFQPVQVSSLRKAHSFSPSDTGLSSEKISPRVAYSFLKT